MIDFKSGRKGFYESHVHQLYLYKDMWEENYPDIPVQSVFNWSPKDWRKSPTYNFECQDDAYDHATDDVFSILESVLLHLVPIYFLAASIVKMQMPVPNVVETVLSKMVKGAAKEKVSNRMSALW